MTGPVPRRRLRADAQRNRDRVLEAADAAFAAEGLSVPVHEVARRAGVGTGTVSRHFPTKEALFEAVFASRVERLVARARQLLADPGAKPGAVFFEFFTEIVAAGAANRGLADALAGAGYDLKSATSGSAERDVLGVLAELLARAQQAGAVRTEVEPADIVSLVSACALPGDPGSPGAAARDRLVAVITAGLRPPDAPS